MSDNPYAGYPSERENGGYGMEPPERMSAMAVLSLVCGIICCIPGLGIAAMIFGAAAMVAIGKSGGRLGGKMIAVIGMALGLLATIVWLTFAIGGASLYRNYVDQVVGGTDEMLQEVVNLKR